MVLCRMVLCRQSMLTLFYYFLCPQRKKIETSRRKKERREKRLEINHDIQIIRFSTSVIQPVYLAFSLRDWQSVLGWMIFCSFWSFYYFSSDFFISVVLLNHFLYLYDFFSDFYFSLHFFLYFFLPFFVSIFFYLSFSTYPFLFPCSHRLIHPTFLFLFLYLSFYYLRLCLTLDFLKVNKYFGRTNERTKEQTNK